MKNTAQFFKQKILFHTNTNNKNICKTVCKMQFLKKTCNLMYQIATVSALFLSDNVQFQNLKWGDQKKKMSAEGT